MDRGIRRAQAGQNQMFDRGKSFEFFGVDYRRKFIQRYRAAGVAGAAAARDDGELQFDTGAHQRGDFFLGVRMQHHERIFHAPVGRVRDVGNARQTVELDIVAAGDAAQFAQHAFAQLQGLLEFVSELIDRSTGQFQQALYDFIVLAARIDRIQAVMQRTDQSLATLAIAQQVILQIRVARYHPDVAQYFVKHLCGTPGAAFFAQRVDDVPCLVAEDAQHDLAVGKRSVVVGDFAQTCGHGSVWVISGSARCAFYLNAAQYSTLLKLLI